MFNRGVAIRNGSLAIYRQQALTETGHLSASGPLCKSDHLRTCGLNARASEKSRFSLRISRHVLSKLTLSLLLLTTFLASLASTPAHAEPPKISDEPLPVTAKEVEALHRAFRGYVAVSFPVGLDVGCNVTEGSYFEKRFTSFARSWFEVTVRTQCGKNEAESFKVWFQCMELNNAGAHGHVVCERSTTPTELQF